MADVNRWDVKDAVLASDLSPTQRLVMLVLVLLTDTSTGRIPRWKSPSIEDLRSQTGLAASTVRTLVDSLVAQGWITRERPSRRAPAIYQLCPVSPPTTGALSEPTTGALAPSEPTTGALSPPTTGPSAPMTGAESADDRRTISSRSRESSAAGAAPHSSHEDAVRDVGGRLGVPDPDARVVVTAVLGRRRRPVDNPRALIRTIPDDELRELLGGVRRAATNADAAAARRQARDCCSDCSPEGWVLAGDGRELEPAVKCQHPRVDKWRRSGLPVGGAA